MPEIDINNFEGVWTNGDREDIPNSYLLECKNLRPVGGKLEKTFAAGIYLSHPSPVEFDNIFVFMDSEFSGGSQRIGVYVNPLTNAVSIYTYDENLGWVASSAFPGFYHRKGRNPVIQRDRVLRILPGDAGEPNGQEAKGIWYGWIDRKILDEKVTIAGNHYVYPVEIVAPDINPDSVLLDNGPFNPEDAGEKKHYRFSYVYDGEQESLLGTHVEECDFGQNQLPKFSFTITAATLNKRITAVKVYRADKPEGPYDYIHTINFLRKNGGAFRDKSAVSAKIWNGRYRIYIPALAEYEFNGAYTYRLLVGSEYYIIAAPAGTGHEIFEMDTPAEAVADHWDEGWTLQHDPAGGVEWVATGETGTSGAFAGEHVAITNTSIAEGTLESRYLLFDETYWRSIIDNKGKAILFKDTEANLGTESDAKSWAVVWETSGLFFIDDNLNGTYTISFFDPELKELAEYPFLDERSIKVNGRFARIIGERLWLANIVLDPGGENEVHEAWIAYSELNQPDVIPARNIMRIVDRGGGPITGLAQVRGNPTVLKRNSITTINNTDYDPSRWYVQESKHNLGNLAEFGYLDVQDRLFVCSHDGIYMLEPNNLAESDRTPTKQLRVSEAINDQYERLSESEKAKTIIGYDKDKGEVIFIFGQDEEEE